jgi:hypothetical protein
MALCDTQIWVAKSQGWIVKSELKMDDSTSTTRYVYTDVQAPPNAKAPDK